MLSAAAAAVVAERKHLANTSPWVDATEERIASFPTKAVEVVVEMLASVTVIGTVLGDPDDRKHRKAAYLPRHWIRISAIGFITKNKIII
mmetsp:Transcript_6971/g.17030  ORF Transcript_6971/g.17030 Transcript_6971/m.17030 type:complete len:90 (-) Transcript_6971:1435-1704(-)